MNIYHEQILDHYQAPRNYGTLSDATVEGEETNPLCGDHLHFFLKVQDGVIEDIKFKGGGCAISMAAASMLTERIRGMKLEEAAAMTDQDVLDELGVPLSPTRTKCGLLAVSGLRKILTN